MCVNWLTVHALRSSSARIESADEGVDGEDDCEGDEHDAEPDEDEEEGLEDGREGFRSHLNARLVLCADAFERIRQLSGARGGCEEALEREGDAPAGLRILREALLERVPVR